MALKPEDKKIMSCSMDSSQRKSNNHPSSLFTINTMRAQKPDPVSSIINKLKPQYYQKPISDPTHTQTHFLTKSSSLSSTTNSSLHRHQQPQSRKTAEKPKKEKIHKSNKGSPEEKLVIEEDDELRRSSIITLGRRKSFCDSKIELKEFLASATARIVAVDMPPFMQIHAVNCARKTQDSLEKHSPGTLASTLKKEFDGVYGPAWHCIVGTSFGSFVTHSVGGFLYFSIDNKLYFLLFKTTVQKAD